MDLNTLSAISLPDQEGTPHKLGDLWSDKPVVVVFLRHFGCHNCRDHAVQLRDRYDDLQRHGLDVIAIGTGDQRYAGAFVRDEKIPYLVLVDDDAKAAHAASVKVASWYRLLHPSTWPASVQAWKRGARIHKAGKRVTQLGATFVVGPGDNVRYSHVDADSTDHASIPDVLAAAGCERARVKAVIFDFYNTLAETPDWGPSWQKLIAEVGYELPDEIRDRWWNDGLDGTEHDEHSQSREHYVAWQQTRTRGMLADCGMPAAVQDELIARVRDIGAHRRMRAYDDVAPVLAELRARGVTLAICSNWDWDLEEAIEAAGLTGTVDIVISSAWIGARKPHRRIYDAVLERTGVAPEQSLFVGDTWSCDVEGPRAMGLRPVYVRRTHLGPDSTAPDDHHEQAVHRSTDLRVVLEILASHGTS